MQKEMKVSTAEKVWNRQKNVGEATKSADLDDEGMKMIKASSASLENNVCLFSLTCFNFTNM